jgi:hypothetical protein
MERTLIESPTHQRVGVWCLTERYGISLVSRPVWVENLQDLGF